MIMKKKVIACLCMLICSSALAGCKIGNTEYVLDTRTISGKHKFAILYSANNYSYKDEYMNKV